MLFLQRPSCPLFCILWPSCITLPTGPCRLLLLPLCPLPLNAFLPSVYHCTTEYSLVYHDYLVLEREFQENKNSVFGLFSIQCLEKPLAYICWALKPCLWRKLAYGRSVARHSGGLRCGLNFPSPAQCLARSKHLTNFTWALGKPLPLTAVDWGSSIRFQSLLCL